MPPWYPMHFVPTHKLMQAVKKSGISAHVLNAAFPDVVNPALGKMGWRLLWELEILTIWCPLKVAAARTFKVPLRSVAVYMVAPHFVSYYAGRFGKSGGAPYYLKVMVDDKDMTPKMNKDEFLSSVVTLVKRPEASMPTLLLLRRSVKLYWECCMIQKN